MADFGPGMGQRSVVGSPEWRWRGGDAGSDRRLSRPESGTGRNSAIGREAGGTARRERESSAEDLETAKRESAGHLDGGDGVTAKEFGVATIDERPRTECERQRQNERDRG